MQLDSRFFEGAEKKLEICIGAGHISLRSLPTSVWHDVVKAANGEILSHIANEYCDAYVLSESSLFVWDDRFLIITCGRSNLIKSFEVFISMIGIDKIQSVRYQRKNEYFSHLQPSRFADDIATLRSYISGVACRVGHLDGHHHYLFNSQRQLLGQNVDNKHCIEIMMSHISGDIAKYLRSSNQQSTEIIDLLKIDHLFEGFILDTYVFSPCGFSVNGINGDKYFTLHITPQEHSSYVSLQTNINDQNKLIAIISQLLAKLSPRSWDIVSFGDLPKNLTLLPIVPQNFCLSHCSNPLELGYNVHFSHYQQVCNEVLSPEFM